MTVSSSTNKNTYAGDASTTVFAFTFPILDETHFTVEEVNDTTGVITSKALTTNYTVSGTGNDTGATNYTSGNITMLVAPASGVTLVIKRNMPFKQETDYVENDVFPAETHEDALDELTMNDQQQEEDLDRSLKLPSSISGVDTEIAVGTVTADEFLKINSAGTGFEFTAIANTTAITLPVSVANGGTGATTASGARTALGLAIGTDVQAFDADLTTLATEFTTASASGAASLAFAEDTDNGSNKCTLQGPSSTADVTVTLPAATTTLIGTDTTDTLTNKSIDCDGTGNTITNVGSSEIKSELITGQTDTAIAAGDIIIYADADDSNNLKKDTVQGILDLVPGASTPDKIEEGNTSVEAVDTGTGYIAVTVDASEVARFTSAGMVFGDTTVATGVADNTETNIVAGKLVISSSTANDYTMELNSRDGTGAKDIVNFADDETSTGTITATGGTTSYNTTSDYRLKENIQPFDCACEVLKQVNVYTYNMKGYRLSRTGVIAHELQKIFPEAVTGEKDGTGPDGVTPKYQAVDYGKLTPLLIRSLQEALEKIETLESKVNTLELNNPK